MAGHEYDEGCQGLLLAVVNQHQGPISWASNNIKGLVCNRGMDYFEKGWERYSLLGVWQSNFRRDQSKSECEISGIKISGGTNPNLSVRSAKTLWEQ
jgi:hypothetical protein